METNDLLSDNMDVRGPVFFKFRIIVAAISQSGDVVRKGVYPNVNDMLGIEGNGYSPVE